MTNTLTLNRPRPELISMIAGALAQSATTALEFHAPNRPAVPLTPRTADLPGLLRDAPAGTRLVSPDGCTIELTPAGCTISNPGRAMVQAIERISR